MNWKGLTEREKDILIAENIFGAEIEWISEGSYKMPYSKNKEMSDGFCPLCHYDGHWGGEKSVPKYSRDMSIAWWVVKEMQNKDEKIREHFKNKIEEIGIFNITADLICKFAIESIKEEK